MALDQQSQLEQLGDFKSRRGLDRDIVEEISYMKGEPQWMRDFRLRALRIFENRPMPTWGASLADIDFQNIFYYIKPMEKQGRTWDEVLEIDVRQARAPGRHR